MASAHNHFQFTLEDVNRIIALTDNTEIRSNILSAAHALDNGHLQLDKENEDFIHELHSGLEIKYLKSTGRYLDDELALRQLPPKNCVNFLINLARAARVSDQAHERYVNNAAERIASIEKTPLPSLSKTEITSLAERWEEEGFHITVLESAIRFSKEIWADKRDDLLSDIDKIVDIGWDNDHTPGKPFHTFFSKRSNTSNTYMYNGNYSIAYIRHQWSGKKGMCIIHFGYNFKKITADFTIYIALKAGLVNFSP